LPYADGPEPARHIRAILADIGCPDGKPDPALIAALGDPLPLRRSAAAAAVSRAQNADALDAVRPLLKDADAEVRLRAALGLAARTDRTAVPVLLALLSDAPLDLAQEAEEFLVRGAGSGAPSVTLTGAMDERVKARKAWSDWWTDHGDKIDFTRA